MAGVTLQELLESGLYFGHPSKQFDPRMKPFIFGKRQGIHIIDLEKTKDYLEKACTYLKEAAKEGKNIIMVGTKRQVRELVKNTAADLGLFYMANRWLGGTMTNFKTLKKRIDRLNELEAKEASGVFGKLTKKDSATARWEKERLMKNLEGVRKMTGIPDIMVVIDARKEENAVREAKKLGLTVVGVVDTNSNPKPLDYPVPANDDGIKGLRLLLAEFGAAIRAGQEERAEEKKATATKEKEKKEAPAEKETTPEEVTVLALDKTAFGKREPAVLKKEIPEEISGEKEEAIKTAKKEKVPDKPKPRPRIRAKVRRIVTKKAVKEKTKKKKEPKKR